ncbi:hypothetical protein SLEP1_g12347 [Rubroshorea leprosula]|uniref:Uncharacterized protein n=1 Tax=Rubroshorea leprosula TaxID=152421 RepID=A0AAV5ILE7_9ROSI|nr:hypothetical protein SLEP1_g12347 [Rubroshorea leprosula]
MKIQNPPALMLGEQVNQPHLPPQNQPIVGGPVQLEPIKAASCMAELGNQQQLQEKIDKGILRFLEKAKETMGIDANPFPDLLAADDLRWVIKEARSRKDQAILDPPRGRNHEGHDLKQRKIGPSQSVVKSSYEGGSRMVKSPLRSPSQKWERVVHPMFPKAQNPKTLRWHLQRKIAEESCRQQMENSGGMADLAQPLPTRMKSV